MIQGARIKAQDKFSMYLASCSLPLLFDTSTNSLNESVKHFGYFFAFVYP